MSNTLANKSIIKLKGKIKGKDNKGEKDFAIFAKKKDMFGKIALKIRKRRKKLNPRHRIMILIFFNHQINLPLNQKNIKKLEKDLDQDRKKDIINRRAKSINNDIS